VSLRYACCQLDDIGEPVDGKLTYFARYYDFVRRADLRLDQSHALCLHDHTGQINWCRLQLEAQIGRAAGAHGHPLHGQWLMTEHLRVYVPFARRYSTDDKATFRIRDYAAGQSGNANFHTSERLPGLRVEHTTNDAAARLRECVSSRTKREQ
jgi:hypothetical protein